MEWMTEYWYIIIPVLAVAMFLFGYRATGTKEEEPQDDKNESRDHKSGHGCCH
jgi:hypothetical protein